MQINIFDDYSWKNAVSHTIDRKGKSKDTKKFVEVRANDLSVDRPPIDPALITARPSVDPPSEDDKLLYHTDLVARWIRDNCDGTNRVWSHDKEFRLVLVHRDSVAIYIDTDKHWDSWYFVISNLSKMLDNDLTMDEREKARADVVVGGFGLPHILAKTVLEVAVDHGIRASEMMERIEAVSEDPRHSMRFEH
ncbi:hypothetical protein PG993_008981 [Apiospora rasikravindrae]|uniref:Uncharacterized protein n=1 Tax=Apiospora rasikravindrae TaxID=990691 RepID=A0ABR1SI24_9PEZI